MNEQLISTDAVEISPGIETMPSEKMLPQSTVNTIVASEKERAYQKGVKDAEAKLMQPPVANSTVAPTVDSEAIIAQAVERIKKDNLSAKAAEDEEARNKQLQSEVQRIASSMRTKVDIARSDIADYDKDIRESGILDITSAVAYSDLAPNGGHVLHALAKSPDKLASFLTLQQTSSQAAANYITTLSKSLEANKEAKLAPKVPAPLDKITPSNTNASGTFNPTSVSDWKRQQREKMGRRR